MDQSNQLFLPWLQTCGALEFLWISGGPASFSRSRLVFGPSNLFEWNWEVSQFPKLLPVCITIHHRAQHIAALLFPVSQRVNAK